LKVLFEFGNEGTGKDVEQPHLKRTELVALFNTLSRISNSLSAVEKFREMLEAQERENRVIHEITDRERLPHHAVSKEEQERILAEDRKRRLEGEGTGDSDEEDDEMERLREELYQMQNRRAPANQTVVEAFKSELTLVWKILKFLTRSYLKLPGTIWNIFVLEMGRVWEWFIGLPVSPRSWRIQRPRLDEL